MLSPWGCLKSSASPRHLLTSSLSFLSRTFHAHDHVLSVVQIHGYSSNTSSRTSVDRRHQWPSVSIRSPWTPARTPQSSLLRLTTKRLTAPLVVAAALAAAVAVAAVATAFDCWLRGPLREKSNYFLRNPEMTCDSESTRFWASHNVAFDGRLFVCSSTDIGVSLVRYCSKWCRLLDRFPGFVYVSSLVLINA